MGDERLGRLAHGVYRTSCASVPGVVHSAQSISCDLNVLEALRDHPQPRA